MTDRELVEEFLRIMPDFHIAAQMVRAMLDHADGLKGDKATFSDCPCEFHRTSRARGLEIERRLAEVLK